MSIQGNYEKANVELLAAQQSRHQGDSTNHATLACALYLRSIAEMLGTAIKKDVKGTKEKS